ncbi:MAG: hypothetical protein ACJ76S_00935 [Solirubrobacteraceae bacterium]
MFERFRRDRSGDDAGTERRGAGTAPAAQAPAPEAGREPAPGDVAAVQYREFGGINWGAAFFGWLVAVGLAAILIALLGAAGAAIGLSSNPADARSAAGTVSVVGAVLLILALMIAYYCGGYVAGRMSRFDGGRQGGAVWIIGLLVTILLAILGAVAGSQYNVLSQLNLPRVPIDEGSLATGGAITLAAIVLGTLLAATLGGKAGQRYHRRVDRTTLAT